jgi:hypothetical protein
MPARQGHAYAATSGQAAKSARGCGIRLPCPSNYAKSAGTGARFWRDGMADHGEVEYATATGNDYPAHEQTYHSFITLVKVVMAIVVTIVVLMAIFLT